MFFIIYLLEDEQELSLGRLIRLQHVYNFLLFHAVILSFLDVLQSFYSNFISFFGTNPLTQCRVPVAIFCVWPRKIIQRNTRGAPWWVVPTSVASHTASLLYKYPNIPETLGESTKINSSRRKFQKPQIQCRHHIGGVHHPHWCLPDDA